VIDSLTQRGFDVVAYDSRGHGQSDGDVCNYGFYEKRDLIQVIDSVPPGPVVLIGSSLGGAVAIQGAAGSDRIAGVVAAEAFSDLRTIAIERAPRILPRPVIERAFRMAEERGRFDSQCRPGRGGGLVADSCAADSRRCRCGDSAGPLAANLLGVEGSEAAAPRTGGPQSVAQQSSELGRDRTLAVGNCAANL
jgi:pimeloyl-ACP methyl ester carboxylesterase